MKRPEFLAKQSRCPTGILGKLVARIMAAETARENALALQFLELSPHDYVLEIGFGHGQTLARAAEIVRNGFLAGVDSSEDMWRMATRRNRRLAAQGKIELKLGESRRIPYEDRRFDKVYSVHTIYFWTEPSEDLREIRRVMRVGGRFVLGFRPNEEKALADFPASVYKFYEPSEVESLLGQAGFEQVRILGNPDLGKSVLFAVAHRTS